MDVMDQIGAVRRTVRTGDRDGDEVKVVVATQTYDADIADVWDAITSAERIPRWFLPVSGDLRLGGRYQLEGNAGGEILECEAPRRLSVTWEFGGGVTWLDVDLAADGPGRTTLELAHAARASELEHWAEYGPGAVGVGWDTGLLGLAIHLDAVESTLDPGSAAAWMMSDEGRAFMTRSSAAWGDAAIAAGEDVEVARGAAERTTAAYVPPVTADAG